MARPSKRRTLSVWMNGIRVGQWMIAGGGGQEFKYAASWLEHPDSRPISLSIPLAETGYVCRGPVVSAYFENLLPDSSEIRQRIGARYEAASLSAFDLLSEIGRDCAGAIQLLKSDEEPMDLRRIEGREMSKREMASLLKGLTAVSAGGKLSGDELRISLAGAQEKTALLYRGGRWMVPHGSTPTTHIVKLPLGRIGGLSLDMSGSVENEWLCLKIVAAMGFKTTNCEIAHFEDVEALVVERFDRKLSSDGSWIMRLPQEDFCQATGTHPRWCKLLSVN
jgi:serine/threonine-protein kinase HipA